MKECGNKSRITAEYLVKVNHWQTREQGSLILETSIVLPIFILIMVFILGIFNVVYAQNQMVHTLVQMSSSLSMDSYLTGKVNSIEKVEGGFDGLDDVFIELKRNVIGNDPHFTSKKEWFYLDADHPLERGTVATADSTIAKNRFIGYLTGGDEKAAEKRLDALGVVNGLNGMTFTMQYDGTDVIVTIEYTLQFWADYFGIGKVPMKQTIRAKRW